MRVDLGKPAGQDLRRAEDGGESVEGEVLSRGRQAGMFGNWVYEVYWFMLLVI